MQTRKPPYDRIKSLREVADDFGESEGEFRNNLKRKVNQKKRRKMKIARGKVQEKKRPEKIENITSLALEYSAGDPLEALHAAVRAIQLVK